MRILGCRARAVKSARLDLNSSGLRMLLPWVEAAPELSRHQGRFQVAAGEGSAEFSMPRRPDSHDPPARGRWRRPLSPPGRRWTVVARTMPVVRLPWLRRPRSARHAARAPDRPRRPCWCRTPWRAFARRLVGSPVSCDITVARGMPPISIPASTSHSGNMATIASATSRNRSRCPSNRYLSKYSSLTCPDRQTESSGEVAGVVDAAREWVGHLLSRRISPGSTNRAHSRRFGS